MHHNLQIKQKPEIHLVFTFTYYRLFPFVINLRLVINNSRTYECSTKLFSYVITGRIFQIALRGNGYSPSGGNGKFLLREMFFLVTNSSLRLKG